MIVLDHRVTEQTSTRRLRILKYRGSLHGTNEYPFLIGESGISVLPITSLGLRHSVSTERVSTGVARLDAMLGDGGFYKGSTVLVSGTAGTGKSTLAAQFCDAACSRGERAMYFAFEESEAEIVRNMSSVGIDLRRWVDAGLLQFRCFRPSLLGLEAHLFAMQKFVGEFDPAVVVMDPVSDLLRIGTGGGRVRHADPPGRLPEGQGRHRPVHQPELRRRAGPGRPADRVRWSTPGCSSRRMEGNGEHNRVLYVLKSRGMAHSNQIREFLLTEPGHRAGRRLRRARRACSPARPARPRRPRNAPTGRPGWRTSSSGGSTWNGGASRSRPRPRPCGASSRTRPTSCGRLLSHGSTGAEDRAGQRAEQGRLRRADTDEPSRGTDRRRRADVDVPAS